MVAVLSCLDDSPIFIEISRRCVGISAVECCTEGFLVNILWNIPKNRKSETGANDELLLLQRCHRCVRTWAPYAVCNILLIYHRDVVSVISVYVSRDIFLHGIFVTFFVRRVYL